MTEPAPDGFPWGISPRSSPLNSLTERLSNMSISSPLLVHGEGNYEPQC
jgi:hypothetical protein